MPIELLGAVFGWIEVKDLYPSCFLVSKHCLQAINDDLIWEARCKRELTIDVKDKGDASSWMQLYKGM